MAAYPLLSFDWIGETHPDRKNIVVMLHGILGQKRNLAGFARAFVAAFPQFQVMLVDLRNHGASQGFEQPHTLEACARDLNELFGHENVKPRSIIGHSFGAGVTAVFANQYNDYVSSIWLLDAVPSEDSNSSQPLESQVDQVLTALEKIASFESKADFMDRLLKQGISQAIASWLAMNLTKSGEQFQFAPHPKDARKMVEDLRRHYSLSLLQTVASRLPVYLVQAERNLQWNSELVAKIKRLSGEVNLQLLCLPQSGHWVHIDNPKGVLDLMARDFA